MIDAAADVRARFEKIRRELKEVNGLSLHGSALLNGSRTDTAGQLASRVQMRMCVNAESMENLCSSVFFDHSAMMALGRMMIDAMTMYFYLREPIDAAEWEFRHTVLLLHDLASRIKLLRDSELPLEEMRQGRGALIEDIRANPVFERLSGEQKKSLASGEVMFVGGMRAAAVRAGWDERRFLAIYNYFSAQIHACPTSYMRWTDHKDDISEPSIHQYDRAWLAFEYARACLLHVTLHFLDNSTVPGALRILARDHQLEKLREENLKDWPMWKTRPGT